MIFRWSVAKRRVFGLLVFLALVCGVEGGAGGAVAFGVLALLVALVVDRPHGLKTTKPRRPLSVEGGAQ